MSQKKPLISTESETAVKERLKKPDMYRVVMLNDDFTPMNFVVDVVCKIFKKTEAEATEIMLSVHRKGSAICGVYTYEVAETKAAEVASCARHAGHPLQCTVEKD